MAKTEPYKGLYTAALPFTEEEALGVLRAATARGMELGEYIASVAVDSLEVGLDDYPEPYQDRAYTLADLDEVADTLAYHEGQAAQIRADIEAETYPESNGWLPGTTADGAREELAYHEEGIAKATKEKADLLREYQESLEDGEDAGEILADYLEERKAWKWGWISRKARELQERKRKKK